MRSFFKSILIPAITLAFSAVMLQACGDTDNGGGTTGGRCTPGSQSQCTCTGMDTGVQTCQPNGTFTPCVCNGNTGGNGGAGGAGGAGGNAQGGAGGAANCHDLPGAGPLCGNGVVDGDEQCDDGNCVASDECNNNCKLPYCGDGIVQAPETCDGDEMCPADCAPMMMGSSSSGGPVDPCVGKAIVAGFAAATKGAFSFGDKVGKEAADAACKLVDGGFEMCDYDMWKELEMFPTDHPTDIAKLGLLITAGSCKTVWLHRTTPVGDTCPAGPGARCNDWNYPTGHLSNGEWVKICNNMPAGTGITYEYKLDCDPIYDGTNTHVQPGFNCSPLYEIPCCYQKCIPMH